MSWSPGQQAMLEAMGYTLWRHAGAGHASAVAAAGVDTAPDSARSHDAAIAAGRVVEAAATPTPRGEDPLLRALRRAAAGADLARLALPPLATLRGDPAAKRALWPKLRALRRTRG